MCAFHIKQAWKINANQKSGKPALVEEVNNDLNQLIYHNSPDAGKMPDEVLMELARVLLDQFLEKHRAQALAFVDYFEYWRH